MICQFPNLGTQKYHKKPQKFRGIIAYLKERMNKLCRINSADDKWTNLAVAHGAGELVGYHQAGGHPAGEHRPHHVHDADRDPPRHRHTCSLSSAAPKEAIPQTPSLQSTSTVEPRRRSHEFRRNDDKRREENSPLILPMQSARMKRKKLRLAPVLVSIKNLKHQQSAKNICVDKTVSDKRWGSISLPLLPPNPCSRTKNQHNSAT